MTEPHDTPNLDDVIDPTESAPRDRREHGKSPDRIDDDYLEYRTEQERIATGLENYDPDHVPPATE
ncbi:MAG: hypothetical protein WAX14_01365 [Rhodococcus sp. (in: high G+C Gram-positive bacteria)]|uniref:hypothetical protein n=1 Tax=Rhodococcus sp. TaxID=1831 RepID=UPI003BB5CC0B